MAKIYNEETEKTFREILDDEDQRLYEAWMEPQELMASMLADQGVPTITKDFEYIEHRIPGDYFNGVEWEQSSIHRDTSGKGWNPYEQDLTNYPEIYKMYGENFDRFERAKKKFEEEVPGEQQGEGPLQDRAPFNRDAYEKRYDDFMPRFSGTSMQ